MEEDNDKTTSSHFHFQKWHPDKHKGDEVVTAKFQAINEAYTVLSDPAKRLEYDPSGNYEIDKYALGEYLARFKGMILACNGLGISQPPTWSQQLMESRDAIDKKDWLLVRLRRARDKIVDDDYKVIARKSTRR